MSVLLLSLSLLANLLRASNSKIIARDYLSKGEDVLFFNSFGALCASLLLFLAKGFKITIDKNSVLLSIIFASFYLIAFLSYSQSLLYGSLSFTTLITSLGMIIPMIYGIVFLSEKVTIQLIFGCCLMIVALVLISLKGKKEEKKFSSKWIFWVTLSFLSSGMIGLFQKLIVSKIERLDTISFMASTFFFLFVISLIVLLIKRGRYVFSGKRLVLGFLQGLFDASQHTLNLILASLLSSVVLYPVLNGGGTLLSVLVSTIVFKEKTDKKGMISIVLLVLSILLISL